MGTTQQRNPGSRNIKSKLKVIAQLRKPREKLHSGKCIAYNTPKKSQVQATRYMLPHNKENIETRNIQAKVQVTTQQ